jgi:NADP-dependent 3-hydroxy acid dehydrogenase YdfG
MAENLDGKIVAVTGASSGIGEAIAVACAAAGASVALAARRSHRLDAVVERISGEGGKAVALAADVAVEEEARNFVHGVHAEFGRLDVLVNNAGVMLLGPINGAPTDEWRRMIDVNVFGVLYCTHAAVPLMLEQGSGHIINISSVAGRVARLGSGVYNLTKFGIGAFSESLRQEVTQAGVRVTLVEPGAVATELVEQNRPEIQSIIRERFTGTTPLEAHEIAAGVLYAIAQPQNVSVNELLIRPTSQQG